MANDLAICNPTPRKLPGPQLLHELVSTDNTGEATAIEHATADGSTIKLRYDEFHHRSHLLAGRIVRVQQQNRRSKKRSIIPILVPQCPELYISQLATLKAGAAFCPIVLDAPEERLRFIIQDIDADVLLTTASVRTQLPAIHGVEIIIVDEDDPGPDEDASFISPSISPQDPAYVMYTSGSTGKPKGVILSHSAATQALLAHDLHIPAFSRFLQFASPTFDVSVFEIFFPWLRGATLVSCDRRRLLNDLPRAINELNIDACELTPSVASSLLRGRESVPSLRLLLTIGEMLKPPVVQEFGGNNEEPSILHGMYGPTEATIHCTLQTHCSKDMSCKNIGVPLDTVSAFVVRAVDSDSVSPSSPEILRIGEEGELAVGGYQLADGYLNRDEQTKAVFVSHPEFGTLYRTGDRAKILADGTIECLGRISSGQVKLRGQRIELGEIEHAASRTPGCRDVVAEVISGSLVVFAVSSSGELKSRDIVETCRAWLPAFMIPGDTVILDALPYLASGKCDRKALRQQYEQSQETGDVSQHPSTAEMQQLCSTIGQILGADVRSDSLLPGLGLDSISAIRLASELSRAELGQLDATDVLTARTPKDLLSALDATSAGIEHIKKRYRSSLDIAVARDLPADLQSQVENSFPCTDTQVAMLSETEKDSWAYCNWIEYTLPDCHDLDYLEEQIRILASHHSSLRSGFISLANNEWSYVNLVWKSLSPEQIIHTTSFDYGFQLTKPADMLRPCSFALMDTQDGARLLLKIHHALYDQWSADVLQADLARLLRGEVCQGGHSFEVVADHFLNATDDGLPSSAIDFWQGLLHNVSPTSLPLLRCQTVPASLGRTAWQSIPVRSDNLNAKVREIGCSAPALFQAAMAYIIGTYAGTNDVTLGTVFSGRTIPVTGIDGVVGPCLATLPMRIDFATASSFGELLRAVTDCNRTMQRHLYTSPTAIRDMAGVAPGTKLFDTLFVWQQSTVNSKEHSSTVQLVDSADQLEFSLVLEFDPSGTDISVRATYQVSLIDARQIDILIRQIGDIAGALLQDSDRTTSEVGSCLTEDLLSISNPAPTSYAERCDLLSTIQRRARLDPTATAIVFANSIEEPAMLTDSITYAELEQRSNQMAHMLIAHDVRPNDIVCICMEKCIDLYVAMLATFKAGGGYLPLIPDTPPDRIRSVLSQAEVRHCLCDSDGATKLRCLSDGNVLDIAGLELQVFPAEPTNTRWDPSRVAYAVFTSGSTGEPKGVAVTMDNLQGNLAALEELYQVEAGDRLLQSCSQAFDVSVFEIFFTFFTGMCLCSATKETMFRDFERSIRALGATHLSLTPTVASLAKPENVPSVRFLVTAGEAVTEAVHRDWAGKGLHQGYGPSETTNICSIRMNTSADDVLGNIGPPFRNTSAFVVSTAEDLEILPTGAYGEYVFGGEQVFKGYIGREDLNSAKIISHPKYGRLYRSGDMGRIMSDGSLLISGRIDDQIKIRGNRVDLGEINSLVSKQSDVTDCTTLVLGEDKSREFLVTFCVVSAGVAAIDDDLVIPTTKSGVVIQVFERLEASLPTYMIPSFVVLLRRLPMTTQGKLDKRLLRSTFQELDGTTRADFARSSELSAPEAIISPEEHAIAEALAESMKIDASSVHRNSSFLGLGLNSLNAIRFARLLEKKLQVRLGVALILRNPSPARLSKALSKKTASSSSYENADVLLPSSLVKATSQLLDKRGISFERILPCTPLQGVMLSASATEGSSAYSNSTKLTFSGDMQRLEECWEQLVRRHAILRTLFMATENQAHPYVQVVLADSPRTWYQIPHRKVNGCSNGKMNGRDHGSQTDPQSEHASVSLDSPVRVDVEGCKVHLRMHHAVYDGIAMSNLLSELRAYYEGGELPAVVSPEPFLRAVALQNNDEAMKFWSQRIQGFEPHPVPTIPDVQSAQEQTIYHEIPIRPSDMEAFSQRHACSTLALLQAAWAKTLACAQDIVDICFGNVVNGRAVSVPDVDRLVFPCFNTIPLRIELDTLRTNVDLVRRLHELHLETLPYQLAAARHIQSLSQRPSARLFDSILLMQPSDESDDDWAIEDAAVDMGIPIVLEIVPYDTCFELRLQYMPDKVSAKDAKHLCVAFQSGLASCLRYPSNSATHFYNFEATEIRSCLKSESTYVADNRQMHESPASQNWSSDEERVRDTLADLASVDHSRLTKETSLYQIGLDSLNAVQVASRLRDAGLVVDAADVMQHQTPAGIAALVAGRKADNEHNSVHQATVDLHAFDSHHRSSMAKTLAINARDIEAIRPCTPSQNGMLAQSIQSQGSLYIGHVTYSVPSEFSVDEILRAWANVQSKHQILRTGFQQIDDVATPFAMLIYQTSVSFDNLITVYEDDTPRSASYNNVAKDIMDTLHNPPWRLGLTRGVRKIMRLSMHHSLYDADSLHSLLQDFSTALRYDDLGQAVTIDAVLKQQLEAIAQHKDDGQKFWSTALQMCQPVKFPSLAPTVISESQMRSHSMSSKTDVTMLNSFCSKEGATIQALGQAVWALLLAEYLGEPNVLFGTVFSGFASNSRPAAFPSISTVPIPCNTGKSHRADVVRDMVSFNASAQRHRFTPLYDIQRHAGMAGQTLFDTVFVYQKSHKSEDNFDWAVLEDSLDVDFAVSMELVTLTEGNVSLRLTYDTKSIPKEHASLILEQYDVILASLLSGLSTEPQIELMSRTEPKESTLQSPVRLLHEFVERGASLHPEDTALEFIHALGEKKMDRVSWTYQGLDERSNQVAHLILQHDVKPGSNVAVCMTKSAEASFAFTGILKAGCAFLAMDPDLPVARRKFILEDSDCRLLFVDSSKSHPELEELVDMIELKEEMLEGLPAVPVEVPEIDPSATSYCLYTSGTTGTPKGCELTHENVVEAMMAFQRLFDGHWTKESRWLQFASYWFDVSVLEQFWTWSVGMTMVSAPRDVVLEDLPGFIRQAGITHIDLTPSLARLVKPEDVPSLHGHVFITGGETLKQEIIDAWGPYNTICNGYGPTEATIGVTMNRFIGKDAKPSNIGPAFDNVGLYVFRPGTDEMTLRGAVGELCISGKLVGKGYLNRPELTAKSFPFLERYGEKVYRTGDLVRLLANGSILFIGRADTQTKLRGQRLEIDEINSVIKESSARISDVASLVTKSDSKGREMLVSFLVDSESGIREVKLSESERSQNLIREVNQACQYRLPGYMVPTHFIPVTRLPLTVNNKVDVKRLTALFSSLSNQDLQKLKGQAGDGGKLSRTEARVAKVLARLLSIDQNDLNAQSNVFSAGLSSVTAINFATQLKRSGFQRASVATIMKNPALRRLAGALTNETSDATDDSSEIKQAQLSLAAYSRKHRAMIASRSSTDISGIESLAPCTPLQTGLLAESLKQPSRPYFNCFRYDISNCDADQVGTAVAQLYQQVAMLKTLFLRTDDGFAQVIFDTTDAPISHSRCEKKTMSLHLKKLKNRWSLCDDQEIIHPFEAHIVQSSEQSILSLHVHHALYDGISWDLIINSLGDLYKQKTVAVSAPSFLNALPYGPLRNRQGEQQFWHKFLAGTTYAPLPKSSAQSDDSDPSVQKRLEVAESLKRIQSQMGASHQAILQTAFAIALHQLAPKTDCYGVVLSGRSIGLEGADKVLGPMFNTIPFPLGLTKSDRWIERLHKAQQEAAAVLPFQHSPIRAIRKACGRPVSDPMFDVLFVFQGSETLKLEKDMPFHAISEQTPAEYPLAFEVGLGHVGDLRVTAVAQSSYANQQILQELVDNFKTALDVMSQSPERLVSEHFNIQVKEAPNSHASSEKSSQNPEMDSIRDFVWTPEAKTLRTTIAELAECDQEVVTEHATIYSLGLDSIDAVKLASRLKRANLKIAVSDILKAQTIPRLLDIVKSQRETNAKPGKGGRLDALVPLLKTLPKQLHNDVQDSVERVLPATPGQEALVADMVRSGFQDYYNSDVLRLRKDIDVARFKNAWRRVVDSSPILRTSFVEVADPEIDVVFAQLVHLPTDLEIDETSINSLGQIDDYLESLRRDVAMTYTLRSPLRLAIFALDSDRYLVLSLAHAQYDGHSLALLHEDIAKAYEDSEIARPGNEDVIESALDAVSDTARSFWRDEMTGLNIRLLVDQDSDGSQVTHRAERVSAVSSQQARERCKDLGVSMQALTGAAWTLLLAFHLQTLDVVTGVVLACRDSEEAEAVMFPTMNTVPVRASVHGSSKDFVQDFQGVMNSVRPYQRTPLRSIQSVCSRVVQHSTSHGNGALFDTLFTYQHRPASKKEFSAPLYESVDGFSNVEYPVAVEVEAVGEQLFLRAAAKDSAFDRAGTSDLLQKLDHVLDYLLTSPDEPVLEFVDSSISVCTLPTFVLQDDSLITSPPPEYHSDSAEDSEGVPDSAFTSLIRSTLAHVAKLPEQDILPHSTIESIGIDSISAIKVSALLRAESIRLSVGEILKAQTLRRMVELAETKTESSTPVSVPAKDVIADALQPIDVGAILKDHEIDDAAVESIMPVLAGQHYMLAMWKISDGKLFYPTFKYEITTKRSIDDLRSAWSQLVSTTSILRTIFVASKNRKVLLQVVLKTVADSFFNSNVAGADPRQPMAQLSAKTTGTGFSLGLKIHHALYDAISLPLLMEKLQALLSDAPPVQTKIDFADYVALSVSPESQSSRKDFWSSYLRGIQSSTLQLAGDKKARKVEIFDPTILPSCSTLAKYARAHQVTVQALLFAIHAKVYASFAAGKAQDVVFGIYIANRTHLPDLVHLTAPTLNLLPLLVRAPGTRSLIESAKAIDSDLRKITNTTNTQASLAEVAEWTGVKIDSFVNYIKHPEASGEADGDTIITPVSEWEGDISRVRGEPHDEHLQVPKGLDDFVPNDAYQHALDIELSMSADGKLSMGLFCREDILSLDEGKRMMDAFRKELRGITEE